MRLFILSLLAPLVAFAAQAQTRIDSINTNITETGGFSRRFIWPGYRLPATPFQATPGILILSHPIKGLLRPLNGLQPPRFNILRSNSGIEAVADLVNEAAEKTVASINQAGGQAISLSGDITSAEVVQETVAKIVATYGQLDCAFNISSNPGIRSSPPYND